jgi:hypothetical protein
MKKPSILLALSALVALPGISAAAEASTIVAGGNATVVYVFPTSPQTFVPVAGLPSFLVMPGAPAPAVATQVVYSVARPAAAVRLGAAIADLDCSNFVGTVIISGPDRYNLDRDGDGIGCEPEDR